MFPSEYRFCSLWFLSLYVLFMPYPERNLNPKQACLKRREEEKSESHFSSPAGNSSHAASLGLSRLTGSSPGTGTSMGFGNNSAHPGTSTTAITTTTSIGPINSASGALGPSFTPNVSYDMRVPVIPPPNGMLQNETVVLQLLSLFACVIMNLHFVHKVTC